MALEASRCEHAGGCAGIHETLDGMFGAEIKKFS